VWVFRFWCFVFVCLFLELSDFDLLCVVFGFFEFLVVLVCFFGWLVVSFFALGGEVCFLGRCLVLSVGGILFGVCGLVCWGLCCFGLLVFRILWFVGFFLVGCCLLVFWF